jgi:hypothetical protein
MTAQQTIMSLTPASLALFIAFAEDAGNWNGMPMVNGNVEVSKQQRGNLSDLVQKGIVRVEDDGGDSFVVFTQQGRECALLFGCEIQNIYA